MDYLTRIAQSKLDSQLAAHSITNLIKLDGSDLACTQREPEI